MSNKRPLTTEEIARVQEVAGATSHYSVLGLTPGASRETIDSAYRAYVREWHPDRFYSRDAGDHKAAIEQNFVNATRAYEILRDDRKRRDYDSEMMATGQMRGNRLATPPKPPAPKPPPPAKPSEPEVPGYEVTFGKPKTEVAPESPKAPPKKAPEPIKPPSPTDAAIQRLRAQFAEQNTKAMSYYQAAKADFDAGHFVKAEGSAYLALKLAPQNADIQALYQKAVEKAKQQKAEALMHSAEQAEQYGRGKEALGYYQKACECDPPDGKPFFHLARLRKSLGEDDSPKELLQLYKKAALKSPKVVEYRMAAAEGYFQLGMVANANREAMAALEVDPKNEAAKALAKKTRT